MDRLHSTESISEVKEPNEEHTDWQDRGPLESCDGLRSYVQNFISSKLSDDSLSMYRAKLETLKKCAFYVEVTCPDLPHSEHSSSSTIQHLIDHGKFQQLKNFGSSQVKIQLCLLEELYEQIRRGKEELVSTLETCSPDTFTEEKVSGVVRGNLDQVASALRDFNDAQTLGRFRFKHRLITEPAVTTELQIQLALAAKPPVLFDKNASVALAKSVRLYWHVAGQERSEPGVKYEIRYRFHPAPEQTADAPACEDQQQPAEDPATPAEGATGGPASGEDKAHLSIITSGSNSTKIGNLLPEKSYEFTIKRADSYCLVYGAWNDTIVLKTLARPAGSTNHKKKRWVYYF
ncbi:fibronectin type III domain-containing protein 11-like [Megalops cyprinoides]|uniref:fibronectin type III domain-containing protein 11-like n=1 Tax=Megalops cyprinoides TaxID=118141 RepID=UPI0018640678|nr:fibronectin type III domain-containing protein 11-like [Megalops cyprinoides]